ncbi:MAG TPA: DUF3467 domain-containing protein [Tepidisphaeraceae bacterium]|jgi:hypothetical protein|nr:DUF3467 domain-containing protein [Tepidisphaeraceae bacterium]
MAEENQPQSDGGQQQAGGVPVLLDERDLRRTYINTYRIHATSDEVIIDLGFNMPDPNPQSGQAQFLLKMTDRIVMNYANAKRLAGSLAQLVKRFEQQFGEIPIQPGARK